MVTCPMASSPPTSTPNSSSSYASAAAIEASTRWRRLPVAAGSREARWSTAATTPAKSANGEVPCSNRSGTRSGEEASLSGRSRSSRAGSATTAPTCGPDHL